MVYDLRGLKYMAKWKMFYVLWLKEKEIYDKAENVLRFVC